MNKKTKTVVAYVALIAVILGVAGTAFYVTLDDEQRYNLKLRLGGEHCCAGDVADGHPCAYKHTTGARRKAADAEACSKGAGTWERAVAPYPPVFAGEDGGPGAPEGAKSGYTGGRWGGWDGGTRGQM
jgi:hypothetical protein